MKIKKVVLALAASFAMASANIHAATTTYYSSATTLTATNLTTPIPAGTQVTVSFTAAYSSGPVATANYTGGILLFNTTSLVGFAGETGYLVGVTTPTSFSFTVTPTGLATRISSSSNGMAVSPTTIIYSFSNVLITGVSAGPALSDTQTSLNNTAAILQGIYTLQNAVIVNGFAYDCSLFDTKGMCISAGGRRTSVQGEGVDNTSGLVIVA
ncbi:MAG: hypothetical protein Q8O24_05020 [Gallionellaceae bacterium]|nr:hypothetical protein [Gallionellaceae bacterium]